MPRTIDPQELEDARIDEAQRRYVEAFARGQTGARLARSAGIPVSQGTSPPTFNPPQSVIPPPMRLDSAANYVRYSPEDEAARDLKNMMGNVPIKQAEDAINAAQKFMAMRGYQKDLEKGVAADQAFMKWAPSLLGGKLTGAGPMLKAMQPAPNYQFVPGAEGAPATFQSPGQRPVIIPRTAMPLPPGGEEFIKKEIIPGVFAIGRPGGTGTQIVKANGDSLTKVERLKLLTAVGNMEKGIGALTEGTPEYKNLREVIDAIKAETMRPGTPIPTGGVSAPIGGTNAPTKKRYVWTREGGVKPVTE